MDANYYNDIDDDNGNGDRDNNITLNDNANDDKEAINNCNYCKEDKEEEYERNASSI